MSAFRPALLVALLVASACASDPAPPALSASPDSAGQSSTSVVPSAYRRLTGAEVDSLAAHVRRAAREAGGHVGVGIVHVQTGQRVSVDGGRPFPMASVAKLPLALAVLDRVDAGALRRDSAVALGPDAFTVDSLLALAVSQSDNPAADALLSLVGGPAAVAAAVRARGVAGVRVDRSFADLAAAQRTDPAGFARDVRDTATPDGMADLLVAVAGSGGPRRAATRRSSRDRLVDVMRAASTGPNRIRGLLPEGTVVAHKTGSWGHGLATNDVGLIETPGGTVALAVFVTGSGQPEAARERVIAGIARLVYDRFATTGSDG